MTELDDIARRLEAVEGVDWSEFRKVFETERYGDFWRSAQFRCRLTSTRSVTACPRWTRRTPQRQPLLPSSSATPPPTFNTSRTVYENWSRPPSASAGTRWGGGSANDRGPRGRVGARPPRCQVNAVQQQEILGSFWLALNPTAGGET